MPKSIPQFMKRRIGLALAALGLLGGVARRSEAGLLLSEVGMQWRFPDASTIYEDFGTALVDPSAEFNLHVPGGRVLLLAEVTDTQLSFTHSSSVGFSSYPFNGFALTSLGGPEFAGASINSATTISGFTSDRLTFTADTLFVNLRGIGFNAGQNLTIDLAFEPAAVPEPSTLAMGGSACVLVAGYAWRRRMRAAASAHRARIGPS
jgi:hypothetical protein